MRKAFLFAAIALLATACARGPNVSSDLPLRRVVIYRNGVGYFERSGHVSDERVSFKMRPEAVGDFLASLAIVERGGSSVRSASFPLEIKDPEKVPPPGGGPDMGYMQPIPPLPPGPPGKEKKDDKLRDVVLHLDGEDHDLTIGYVAETPVWRPSYRLVLTLDGKASLQTWSLG